MKIKIVNGVYGWHHDGYVEPVEAGTIINVTEEQAQKAVSRGVAVTVDDSIDALPANLAAGTPPTDETVDNMSEAKTPVRGKQRAKKASASKAPVLSVEDVVE